MSPISLAVPFPPPPPAVRAALSALQAIASGDQEAVDDLDEITDLPRPWLPAGCPPGLRGQIWRWCDDVVTWLNGQYCWRPAGMIPPCWPRHPHLAQELPVLACLRIAAEDAYTPDLLEEWHRYALTTFLDRATARLGESCRAGRHTDWPGGPRYDGHASDEAAADRQAVIDGDVQRAYLRPVVDR